MAPETRRADCGSRQVDAGEMVGGQRGRARLRTQVRQRRAVLTDRRLWVRAATTVENVPDSANVPTPADHTELDRQLDTQLNRIGAASATDNSKPATDDDADERRGQPFRGTPMAAAFR